MRALTLTFDDGPDTLWTAELLDLLEQLEIRATFFPITARAAASPDLIRRMTRDGHGVGLHCHEHIRHTARDEAWLREDTLTGLAELADLGVLPQFWRPPWGVSAPWTAQVAADNGLTLVHWTVDTHDWRGDSAESMFDATRSDLVDGAVILAHDGIGPGALRASVAQTLDYVRRVAEFAAAYDLAFTTLNAHSLR